MCYLDTADASFTSVILFIDDADLILGFIIVYFSEWLTSSTSVRVTRKPTQARGVFCKDSSKSLNIFFAIALASPRGKVDCGRN